jgi:hypothetical protein
MIDNNSDQYPREFEIREILQIAWKVYRNHYSDLFILAFIVYLPLNIFLAFFPITSLSDFNPSNYLSWLRIFGSMVIAVYLSFFGNIAFAIALKKSLYTRDYYLKSVFREINSKFRNDLTINLFMMLIVFLCFHIWMYFSITYPALFLILLIPIVVYLIYWSFSIYIFSFGNYNLYQSMKLSYSIVNGRWSKIFYYVLSFIFLSSFTTLLVGLPYSFLHDSIIIKIIYSNFVSLITSYYVVAFIIFYVNFEDTKK